MSHSGTVIVITGPTASGKSALAVQVAKALGAEIVSADSRQVFTGIPIVTAMPTDEQRCAVPHHLIDMLPLEAYYSAATFEQDALRIIRSLFERGDRYVVVCGGSMMYIDALCNGIDDIPTVPDAIRRDTVERWQRLGDDAMRNELQRLDPEGFKRIDILNMRRVIHAIEICHTAGKPYSSLLTGRKAEREFEIRKYAIDMPREILFDRINRRVDEMVEQGLVEEARRVYPLRHLNSLNTVGIKEMVAYFDGVMDLTTAIERIKKNTRVYAKKQLTWLKRDPDVIYLPPTQLL